MAQHGAGLGPIRLQKGLAQRRRHHALLGLRHVRKSVAHPMYAAALPGGAEYPADRRFQPLMGIRDHQRDPPQAASRQALQKARPEGFGLRRADVQPNDLASAIGVDCHSDYRGDRDDAAALALLQVGGVEPQIRPLAGERPVEERMPALVDLLAQLGNLRLADPRQPHRLHQIVDPPGRHAADPGLLDHRDQRLLRALASFEKRREVTALPQLRDAQLQRAEAGVERAVAVAVAPGAPLAAALITPGADQPLDVGLHQQLQYRLRHGSQKISVASLLHQLGQHQSLFGHRVLSRFRLKSRNSTLPPGPMATPTTPQPYTAERPENSTTSVDANH